MFSSALLARSMAKRARFVWSRRSYLIALRHSLRPSNSHNSGRRSSGAILRASLTACPYCSARKKACAVACTRSAVVSGLLAIGFARPSRCIFCSCSEGSNGWSSGTTSRARFTCSSASLYQPAFSKTLLCLNCSFASVGTSLNTRPK